MRGFIVSALMVAALAASVARAADHALILTNGDYDTLPDARETLKARDIGEILRAAGFEVRQGVNLPARALLRQAQEFQAEAQTHDAGRLIVVLAGHVVSSGRDSWLLGRDAVDPDALTVGAQGVPLGALARVMADRAGQAVMMVVPAQSGLAPGPGLTVGVPVMDLPQGVTLLQGGADDLGGVLRDGLLQPGVGYGDIVRMLPDGVTMVGLRAGEMAFTPARRMPDGQSQAETPQAAQDRAYWQAVQDVGTVASYESYQRRFPDGAFAVQAAQRLADLRDAPRRQAEAAEQALGLDRAARREVQRKLTLLGYDTRGVDGLFGPGTRGAVAAFQRANGLEETGHLTEGLLQALNRQAARAEEAAAREERANDTAYWDQTGARGDMEGLSAYLNRYPQGRFAETARARLSDLEAAAERDAQRQDRSAWQEAQSVDSVSAYRAYLDRFPQGIFAQDARARIAAQQGPQPDPDQARQDRAEERQVAGNPVTRLLIEKRLAQLGHNPGAADGTFDEATRRAVRAFQASVGLTETGFVSQAALVRLLGMGGRD